MTGNDIELSNNKLQKRGTFSLKEKGQYGLAFIVIAAMLVVTNIPVFVVFFFGIFAYFVIRMFSAGNGSGTREIFEFYLSASEILREDDRRWYGFEVKEVIERGERILERMSASPPLVRFALGALYHKAGDHKAAVSKLSQVVEDPYSDESAYVFPSPELRNYVKILRKIERDPADAPMTSAAVRALERARRMRGKVLLEESRTAFSTGVPIRELADAKSGQDHVDTADEHSSSPVPATIADAFAINAPSKYSHVGAKTGASSADGKYSDRKPISELLHDIYDRNVS